MKETDNDEQFYRDTESVAFPKIDDRQLAQLEPLGQRRILRRGEFLYRAGQRDLGMSVLISGGLEVVEIRDGKELVLATPAGAYRYSALYRTHRPRADARLRCHLLDRHPQLVAPVPLHRQDRS